MKRLCAAIGAALSLGGCKAAPLGYLGPAGPAARVLASLGWGLLIISAVVCLIVLALLIFAMARRRPPEDGALGGGDDRAAIQWIIGGAGFSTLVLLGAAIWTLWAAQTVTNASTPAGLTIDVTGHQWWWEARYRSDARSREFTTANELVIPVGVPVQVNLRSNDVIHTFWVPRLAGKTDTIPGVTNRTRIEADKPGIYRGQCSEYCGLEHAHMAFFVVAVSSGRVQCLVGSPASGGDVRALQSGTAGFLDKCAACHAVRGLSAGGILGPDLSHFGEPQNHRRGRSREHSRNLAYWIDHTQTVKPGAKMPSLDLPPDRVKAVTDYLEKLK